MGDAIHIVQFVMLVPICAILGGITAGVIKMILAHQVERTRINAQAGNTGNDTLRSEIEALRQELGRLRDTSTQYDISIQHTLEDMQQRLKRLESRRPTYPAETAEERVSVRGS